MHRLDHGVYSHPKEVFLGGGDGGGGGGGGVESEPMLTPREKSPLPGKKFSPEEGRTHDAASSRTERPTHYQRAKPIVHFFYYLL